MQKLVFLAAFLLLALFACKNDPKLKPGENPPPLNHQAGKQANPEVLAGHWIAMDFCGYASQYGSVIAAMNNSHLPYAYALSFNPTWPDSVTCYNAYESWKLPVRYNADTLELKNAHAGKSIFLMYHSTTNQEITMVDPTGPTTTLTRMVKSKAGTKDGYTAFTTALNHNLFSGIFTLIGKGETNPVTFTPGGFLQGLKGFDRYEVCTGGDCFMAGQDMDVITLSYSKDPEKSTKYFGYRYNGQNDTLTIYNLKDMNPGEKGQYKATTPAFKFARKKTD